ncbi:MAG: flagellar motor switch protein FliM [Planctomycetota bacterium]|jgi:flagellar motor switch protein FliM
MSPSEEGKLSKDEVEALLQATEGEEEELPPERLEPQRRVHGYDFQQPSRFNKSQLDALRKINDSLAQSAAEHVSRLLRSSLKTQLVSMDQMKWEHLLEEAGEAVVGFVFSLDPLGYQGVLTLDRQFAAACLDRMTGGQGEVPDVPTDFTVLDVRALARFVAGFLDPLSELWHDVGDFQVVPGPFVQELQSLDLLPPEEDLFQLCFLVQGTVASGQVALSVPFRAVRSLPPQSEEQDHPVAVSEEAAEAGLRATLKRAPVEITVLLGSAEIKVAKLVSIEPDDVILLDTRIGDPLDVKVNDKVKFQAYPGVSKGKLAAKLIVEG